MSLYYEAAKVLEDIADGSKPLKQRVYNDKSLKSSPGAVFALVSEASKWSQILSEVIENSGILKIERKLTPALSLVLVHDLLLAKKGLSASKKHPLFDLISNHKARLTSELTRARLKRGAPSLDNLRDQLQSGTDDEEGSFHPRWVRINTVKTSKADCMANLFKDNEQQSSLQALQKCGRTGIYLDEHIPNLVAIHPSIDLTKTQAYRDGHIILQDKASCFPAYLLDPSTCPGRVIDGCAAPGNKTTHLAAILAEHGSDEAAGVVACERNKDRAQILKTMVNRAGAGKIVNVLANQDFLALDPRSTKFSDVTGILLDPSCSGSGIVGRDAAAHIPIVFPGSGPATVQSASKKRKRGSAAPATVAPPAPVTEAEDEDEETPDAAPTSADALEARLRSLSAFQQHIVEHAMRFPAARRITYSTCSIHGAENEHVAAKVLASKVARENGWRVLRREEQVAGMKKWTRRGDLDECKKVLGEEEGAEELKEACIRAAKGTDEGTMGFFVVGFVRDDVDEDGKRVAQEALPAEEEAEDGGEQDEDWGGFSD